jgi:hypothetical protein
VRSRRPALTLEWWTSHPTNPDRRWSMTFEQTQHDTQQDDAQWTSVSNPRRVRI